MEGARVEKTEAGLALIGMVDCQTVPALVKQMPGSLSREFELDVSASSKIDSAGLAMLIDWGNRHLQPDEKIRLRGASLKVRQLIDIMHLGDFFELLA